MMIRILKNLLQSRSGTSGIEFSFVAPVIILFFICSVVVFDMFRTYQNIVEANSVVADVISRRTSVDAAFISNIYGVFTNLQQDSTAPSALRISSIKKTAGAYETAWKRESGTVSLLAPPNLDASALPEIADGDSIIYVEGVTTYTMLSNILGFGEMKFAEQAFTRPRFIGAITFN